MSTEETTIYYYPMFITFTGIDAKTDLKRCQELSNRYRTLEWGILWSDTNTDNRYTGKDRIQEAIGLGLNVSVHLCGSAARRALETAKFDDALENVSNVQINAKDSDYDYDILSDLSLPKDVIRQTRNKDKFPEVPRRVFCLFDCSGGRGKEIDKFPPPPKISESVVGYAGGLGPDNVVDFLNRLTEGHDFWIDMESKIRTDDWFDLDKCEQVCKLVYG